MTTTILNDVRELKMDELEVASGGRITNLRNLATGITGSPTGTSPVTSSPTAMEVAAQGLGEITAAGGH